jgi:hypothetical protein
MVEPSLEDVFPGLRGKSYQVRSPKDSRYNCVAFAAGDDHTWWWPDAAGDDTWPAAVPRAETVEAFRDAFATFGYVVCDDDSPEIGYEKIALFALAGLPKHASRQIPGGRWVSKLGLSEDIEHALHDLAGTVYGSVVLVMKRAVPTASPPGTAAAIHP